MAVCDWRTLLLVVCILQLVVTIQRQVFDFLGYMWFPIIMNFINIILIIFGCFGAVQFITRYLLAYVVWSFLWIIWNVFLLCYYLNLGTLNRESGLLSLGTGSVSWWEGNGWGCQPVWGEVDGPGSWRPVRVDGCFLHWPHVELAQSTLAVILTVAALPLIIVCARQSYKKSKSTDNKPSSHSVYTIELTPTEATVSENSLKPMTPRRVKRRSGSRGAGSSSRRSRRSYRNAAYSSAGSLARGSRPNSAHSSYSNFHAARPVSHYLPDPDDCHKDEFELHAPSESVPTLLPGYEFSRYLSPGYDVVGPYKEPVNMYGYENLPQMGYVSPFPASDAADWEPPPPAPPHNARATPQAPGPPAYQK